VSWELILRPEAEAEIEEASNWYEERSPGLGAKFIGAAEMTLLAIRQNPFQYQAVSGQLRRVMLRRFPYGLLYVVSGREITVVTCFHGRRDPKIWQERS
jgi:plasmid stabilization system protein ParE